MDNDTSPGQSPPSDLTGVFSPRQQQAMQWLASLFGDDDFSLQMASADASFRQYWRVYQQGQSFILMDAPPEHEDCRPFVAIARKLHGAGIHVPAIHDSNLEQGFLLLEDFGNRDYLQAFKQQPATADALYADAMTALLRIQAADSNDLPDYDAPRLHEEMALFRDWFLVRHLGAELTTGDRQILDSAFAMLADNALQQPQVFVHRDYHSRNLMVVRDNNPGVLDFQDAVRGPVTYDLVSLLRDCYIKWPPDQVSHWREHYRRQWQAASGQSIATDQWQRWFDLMGAQRHLKAIGIFCRLNYRDGKSGYLRDIPRTLGYLHALAGMYPELHELLTLIDNCCPRVNRQCGH